MKEMQAIFKNRISLVMLLLLYGGLAFVSCNKNPDYLRNNRAGGPPTIERVRTTDSTTKDSSFKSATLGSRLVIVGNNLANAQTVSFNGYKVNVNPVYATNSSLVIAVPDSTPTVATNPNVANEIRVTTPLGEAVYKFTILPPAPVIDHISNEYANIGDQITIYGKYFYFVDTVLFPGNVKVASGITTSADGTALTVTIPQGTNASQGNIRVKSKSGWSAPARESKLYDHSGIGMLVDWDTKNPGGSILNFGWGLDAGTKVTNSFAGINPIAGNYAMINMSVPGNWGWSNDKVIDMDDFDGSINHGKIFPVTPANVYDSTAPVSNFDLKFEIASTKPVGELMVQVWQNNYQVNLPLKNIVKSADGKWYTFSANLGDLDNGGAKLSKLKDLMKPQSIRVLLVNSTPNDIPTTVAIDNIRIVRML